MDQKGLVRISRALGDPTRLRIYESIAGKEQMFCGEIVQRYRLTPGTVSHHLKILADANLIRCRREGQFIYNRARRDTIRAYVLALNRLGAKRKAASSR
ncbi:MAG: metalloregulator ArsR/SmtB family transcription factor [Candidatus Sulfotelmatobacter sp.]